MRERIWLLPLGIAWFTLAWATYWQTSALDQLNTPVWWIFPIGNGIASLWFWVKAEHPRWFIQGATIMALTYGIARGLVYVAEGLYAPLAVWSLFVMMGLHAYKLGGMLQRANDGRTGG